MHVHRHNRVVAGSMLRAGFTRQLTSARTLHAYSRAGMLLGGAACRSHAAALHSTAAAAAAGGTATEYPHTSVMLNEVLGFFKDCHVETYVDCTLGAAGHATAMCREHPELHTMIGFDQDPSALQIAQGRLSSLPKPPTNIHLVNANYSEMLTSLAQINIPEGSVNGMLMDLGVSSMQIDQAERGFSFMMDGPLDMRMNPASTLSAEEVLNTWSEAELARIIREYGEEKLWKVVARRIVRAREEEPIRTTQQLVKAVGYTSVTKDRKGGGKQIHPATRTFQAIRIAVNDELQQLEEALPQAIQSLAPGGRLGVISFHGLEDRIVKKAFQRAAGRVENSEPISFYSEPSTTTPRPVPTVKMLHRKPAVPSEAEVQDNPRSRSAKLRFIEKL